MYIQHMGAIRPISYFTITDSNCAKSTVTFVRTYVPQAPTVSLLMIGCRLRTMRYICNHQVAP